MDGTHTCDGGSSSANSSVTAVTDFLPLEKTKSIVWNHYGYPA